jgi:hypothetical protein
MGINQDIKNRIREIIAEESGSNEKWAEFFTFDEIPPKKLANAVKAYAPLVGDEEAVILYDCSIFGSAKEGFLLTGKNLYISFNKETVAVKDIFIIGIGTNETGEYNTEFYVGINTEASSRIFEVVISTIIINERRLQTVSMIKRIIDLLASI